MIDQQENQPREMSLEYLTATLLDFFRSPKNEDRYVEAARIALNQISRSSNQSVEKLEKRYLFFASALKNNLSTVAIREFSSKCIEAAKKTRHLSKAEEKPFVTRRSLQKKALGDVAQALASGHSQQAAIHRAANQLIRQQRAQRAQDRLSAMIESHPLKDAFVALDVKMTLAKEDIRQQLLRLPRRSHRCSNGSGVLFGLLEKAKAFAPARLHQLLGDELFFLCRPTGFLDPQSTTIVVEVPSSAHLHALTYRKLEIITALKKDDHFRALKKLHLRVT